jgi:hypothetical protein
MVECEPPGGNPDQARYHSKEGGFAGTISSGHDQRLSCWHPETDMAEYLAAASKAGQVLCAKFHHDRRPGPGVGQYPKNPNIFRIFGEDLGEYGVAREKTL